MRQSLKRKIAITELEKKALKGLGEESFAEPFRLN